MKKSIIKIFLPCFLYLSLIVNVCSQSNVLIQDGVYVSTLSQGEIIPESQFSAYISLTMKYDSSLIMYDFAECKLNSTRLRLMNWVRGGLIDSLEANVISDLNRTDSVRIHSGDTISFFRDLKWFNIFDHSMKQNNFYSRDTLKYVVELLEYGTNNRLALLDSFFVQRQLPSGVPNFLGIKSPFERVKFITPNSLNNKLAYLKLSIFTNGDGQFYPARRTGFGTGFSLLLELPQKADYREKFGVNPANKTNSLKIKRDKIN